MRKGDKSMNKLLKIYESVIRHEKETTSMEEYVTEEIIQLSKPFEEKLSIEELEELQDAMFSVALTAEQKGFQLGVKYLAKLLAECLS